MKRGFVCATVIATTLLLGVGTACSSAVLAQTSSSGQKVFHGTGIVTAVEPDGSLTVNHQPIAGLMPAMEMTFKVASRSLSNGVRPGDRIEFDVEGQHYTIQQLKVVGHTQ